MHSKREIVCELRKEITHLNWVYRVFFGSSCYTVLSLQAVDKSSVCNFSSSNQTSFSCEILSSDLKYPLTILTGEWHVDFLCSVLLLIGMLNPTCWKDLVFQGLLLELILQRLSEFSIKDIPNPKNNLGLEGKHTQVPSSESQIVKIWINEHALINNWLKYKQKTKIDKQASKEI